MEHACHRYSFTPKCRAVLENGFTAQAKSSWPCTLIGLSETSRIGQSLQLLRFSSDAKKSDSASKPTWAYNTVNRAVGMPVPPRQGQKAATHERGVAARVVPEVVAQHGSGNYKSKGVDSIVGRACRGPSPWGKPISLPATSSPVGEATPKESLST